MGKILVIDDDVDILNVVQLLLTLKGFSVEVTHRWEETFDKIKSFHPDVILLDVALAGNDGRVICKQLKTSEDTKDISIVLFSANHNMQNSITESMADDFLAKPFDSEDLINKINSQLAN